MVASKLVVQCLSYQVLSETCLPPCVAGWMPAWLPACLHACLPACLGGMSNLQNLKFRFFFRSEKHLNSELLKNLDNYIGSVHI